MANGTLGVLIGGKHTLKDWGLDWTKITLGFPEAKTYEQDIPGADGVLDFTESMTAGDVKYKERPLSLEFEAPDRDFFEWSMLLSEIANYIVGQRMRIILDNDPAFFYFGRLTVDAEKTDKDKSTITLSGSLDPYKYELYSSLEDWVWDTFNFETGVIREYKDLAVNGTYELSIFGLRKRIVPVIDCSVPMKVIYKGQQYALPAGKSKVFDIWLGAGDNLLTFVGNGVVSVDYRGGSL